MPKPAALFAVILFTVTTPASGAEKQNLFDYSTQIGIAEVATTGDGCLTISNASLRENQPIKLVILGQVVEKRIEKKLKTTCSRNPETPPDASFYAFPIGNEYFDPAIAIVDPLGDFTVVEGNRVDLNGDGTAESFRSCTSNEGLHLTVWAGEALKSKRLWHEYYYLGYDVVASCNPADYMD
jgi:hypothetical protein